MSERQLFSNANNHILHVVHSTSNNLLEKNEIAPRNRWTLRQKIHLSITISLFLLCLVLIAIYAHQVTVNESRSIGKSNAGGLNQTTAGEKNTCYDAHCIQTAARILTFVDENVEPCQDFYRHACGGWFKKHSIPDNQLWWDTFSILEQENLKVLKKSIEGKSNQDNEATIKMKTLYQSCNDEKTIKMLGIEPLKRLIKDCGCDPTGKEWDLVLFLSQVHRYFPPYLYGQASSPLFVTEVIVDKTLSSRYIVQISQPNFDFPSIRGNQFNPLEELYNGNGNYLKSPTQFLRKIYEKQSTNVSKLEEGARKLHEELNKASFNPEELRDVRSAYTILTVSQLNKETGRQFPWLRYINAVLKPIGIRFNKSSLVATRPLKYLNSMVQLIKETPNETLNYYFLWTLVNSFGKYVLDAEETSNRFVDGPRWERCMKIVEEYMGMALGSLYVKNTFNNESIDHIQEMVTDLKGTFIDNLQTVDWMDKKTKQEAKAKAQNMFASVGYPSFIVNDKDLSAYYSEIEIYSKEYFQNILNLRRFLKLKNLHKLRTRVNRDEWSHPPTIINAFYDVGRNKMILFAGILHPPFYSRKGLMSLNYGSLGTVMGHEFSHGFDDQGRLYDSKGNINEWWTPESSKSFDKKAKCIARQYSNFSFKGVYLNGNATIGENLADNIGVKIAYKAYQRWLNKHGNESKLPGITMTSDQLFFIGYAQMWCSLESDKVLVFGMESHSPNMFRVVGSLQNSPEFAKVFNCKEDSKMNPSQKCSIW